MGKELNRQQVEEIVQSVYSGSMAKKLKNNASYSLTGMGIGAIFGVIVASFLNKNRVVYGMGGAAAFGLGGYLLSKKIHKSNGNKL